MQWFPCLADGKRPSANSARPGTKLAGWCSIASSSKCAGGYSNSAARMIGMRSQGKPDRNREHRLVPLPGPARRGLLNPATTSSPPQTRLLPRPLYSRPQMRSDADRVSRRASPNLQQATTLTGGVSQARSLASTADKTSRSMTRRTCGVVEACCRGLSAPQQAGPAQHECAELAPRAVGSPS